MGSFREEFERTESTLARHRAAIKERLIDAVTDGIAHLLSNGWELNKMPPGLREEFLSLMNDLTRKTATL
jgi:hypothetical protein